MTSQPFSSIINEELAEQLLASAGPVNVIQAGERLYQALRQIRQTEALESQQFILFQQLTPAVLHLVEGISTVIDQQQTVKKRRKTLQLCLQLCRHSCLGFYQLHKRQQLSDEQKKIAIYMALQLIGQDLALRYRFQTPLSKTLWKVSAELYFFACQHQFLEDVLTVKIPDFLPLKTIAGVIKRNILFTLSTTELNDASDWKTLFDFAAHHAGLIQLASHQQAPLFFYWNTAEGYPTQLKSLHQTFSPKDLFIRCHDLVEALQNNRIQLNVPEAKREKIWRHLTGYQKLINDAHPAPPIIFNAALGFEHCWRYLLDRQKLNKIRQLSGQISIDNAPSHSNDDNFYNLSLSPLDSEKGFVDPNESADISDNQKLAPVKFQASGDADYFLFEGKDLNVNNGDFVVLANNRNALLAGIVRQQKELPNFAMQRILIEKVHGELSAHCYQLDGDDAPSGNAIVLNENSNSAEIFLSDSSIKPSTSIRLDQRAAQIGNCRQYSAALLRFQLLFSD